ncbi:MAG: hypothetical protein GTO30_07385, partial [Acidobacteria bacterium]|nr:hypothetical protein [Acidobacteriota bacterium]NIQ85740.1 hypothetical protein [Acidobacteriota bacterium]
MGRSLGGAFQAAATHWNKYSDVRPEEHPARVRESDAAPRGRQRGARSRRGAQRRLPDRGEDKSAGAARGRPKPKPGEDGWDDDYFFTALPTVPQMSEDDGEPNRYGGAPAPSADSESRRSEQ